MSDNRTVRIKIHGREYTIKSAQDPQVTKEYAEYIDRKMREISHKSGSFDTNTVTVLTLLQITHELFSMRKNVDRQGLDYNERMAKIIEKLDKMTGKGGVQTTLVD
ncbi:MAG: cell division protein ZapA [Nitrospinae bacterium]|nr:cell division protein ZapA [Nitrospinota bacterium]